MSTLMLLAKQNRTKDFRLKSEDDCGGAAARADGRLVAGYVNKKN